MRVIRCITCKEIPVITFGATLLERGGAVPRVIVTCRCIESLIPINETNIEAVLLAIGLSDYRSSEVIR